MLIAAISSRYPAAIDNWSRKTCSKAWGEIVFESELFDFDQTSFYKGSMGSDIQKKLFAFHSLIPPATLPKIKLQSNEWEQEYRRQNDYPEERPLNIDPGYLTEAKLVLATTKDRDHRIYLRDGIFAEITLFYKQGAWECSRWTYPDYKTSPYHDFFDRCREYLRNRYQERTDY
ncbi:MAG: DUF4416 family protein [Planctomycetota bacterium]